MNNISHLLNYEVKEETKDNHELGASVTLIRDKIGFTGAYGRGYWSRKVKQKGFTKFRIEQLVDEALALPSKYNRGGWLSNQLK